MNLPKISRHRTVKLPRGNDNHQVMTNSIETLSVIGVTDLGLLLNRLASDVSTGNLLQKWMNVGHDNATPLGIDFSPL